jgi:predicted double-glycine peptidase
VKRAIGTLLVPLALSFTQVGCHLGSLRTGVTPTRSVDSGWLLVPGVPLVTQRERADCGAAALAMVLRFWQPAMSNETVRASVGTVDEQKGIAAGRLREIARDRGLQAFLIQATFEDLVREVSQGRPVIVGTLQIEGKRGYPHYEVVVGVNPRDREVLTADPAEGWRERDLDDFEPLWRPSKRLALVMFATDARTGSIERWNGPSRSTPAIAARPASPTAAGPAASSAPPSPAPSR